MLPGNYFSGDEIFLWLDTKFSEQNFDADGFYYFVQNYQQYGCYAYVGCTLLGHDCANCHVIIYRISQKCSGPFLSWMSILSTSTDYVNLEVFGLGGGSQIYFRIKVNNNEPGTRIGNWFSATDWTAQHHAYVDGLYTRRWKLVSAYTINVRATRKLDFLKYT